MGMMQGMAASNTIIQTIVSEDKRGRVMSYYTMAFVGMAPFGSLLAGTMANTRDSTDASGHRRGHCSERRAMDRDYQRRGRRDRCGVVVHAAACPAARGAAHLSGARALSLRLKRWRPSKWQS